MNTERTTDIFCLSRPVFLYSEFVSFSSFPVFHLPPSFLLTVSASRMAGQTRKQLRMRLNKTTYNMTYCEGRRPARRGREANSRQAADPPSRSSHFYMSITRSHCLRLLPANGLGQAALGEGGSPTERDRGSRGFPLPAPSSPAHPRIPGQSCAGGACFW